MLQQIKRRNVSKNSRLTKPTFGDLGPEKVISTLPKKTGQGNGIHSLLVIDSCGGKINRTHRIVDFIIQFQSPK